MKAVRVTAYFVADYMICGHTGSWRVYHEAQPKDMLAEFRRIKEARKYVDARITERSVND